MMKKTIGTLLVVITTFTCLFAQNKKQPVTPAQESSKEVKPTETKPTENQPVNALTDHYYKKYLTALQWNDNEVAKDALYDLIIENPQNDSLIFNLAYYYYENQKYISSVLVSQQLLKRNPKNTGALEMAAIGYEMMGVRDRSLQSYESLYLLTNDITTLYKMAYLQFELKRFAEALASLDILMVKNDVDTLKLVFNDAANQQKEYVMKVAVLNLRGMVIQEHMGDTAGAKKLYQEALALAPDFVPAKQNLEKLK